MRRARRGRTNRFETRILLAILAVGVVALGVALVLGRMVIGEAISIGLNRRVRGQLEQSLGVHRALIEASRDEAIHCADGIARSHALHEALAANDPDRLRGLLGDEIERCPAVGRIAIVDAEGRVVVQSSRADRLDASLHRLRTLRRSVVLADDHAARVELTVGLDQRLFRDYSRAGELSRDFDFLARARDPLERLYLVAFTLLLGTVTALAVAVGLVVARRVTRRVGDVAAGVSRVAAGDLTVQIPVRSDDEIADLTRAFNDMVRELSESRERIEYLSRIGAWQEFARRLAHEIKNPLTPIQLAVQQVHSAWGQGPESAGFDAARYGKTLEDARTIVEEEVNTLRRLVGEFSAFAKLPEARLAPSDLRELVRDCEQSIVLAAGGEGVTLDWRVPEGPIPVSIDPMMLKRCIDNLVRNAVQAIQGAGGARRGSVVIEAGTRGDDAFLEVRDDGPGIAVDARTRIFDPYYTTRAEGTGLGLAIVKKVVLEHGGDVVCRDSPGGGAAFVITLPLRPGSESSR